MTTTVWVSPSATAFSCLCEPCLDEARETELLFSDALTAAGVRGSLPIDADVTVVRCTAGHEIVLRRIERPPGLPRHDERQLQIA
jgi:hypothetical protein